MEDVLDLYSKVSDEKQARLVFDERPCQLIGQVVIPLPMQPEKVLGEDYEYTRNDTACILLAYDLDTHQRYVQVRKRLPSKTMPGLSRLCPVYAMADRKPLYLYRATTLSTRQC